MTIDTLAKTKKIIKVNGRCIGHIEGETTMEIRSNKKSPDRALAGWLRRWEYPNPSYSSMSKKGGKAWLR